MKALGMIEVYGWLAAVEALDSALKAANVNLQSVTKVRGGLVTVLVTGDVGAVKAAMDASACAAGRVGTVVCVHVIPRPAADVEKMLSADTPLPPDAPLPPLGEGTPRAQKEEPQTDPEMEPAPETKVSVPETAPEPFSRERLEGMKVVEMRNYARAIGLDNMSRKEIKFAKREELIEKICEFQNRRDD